MTDDDAATAPAAAPEPVGEPDRFEAAVSDWLDAHIRNSPVSRATEAWNHLTAALPALVAALKEV